MEHELPISYKMKNLEETEVTRNQMMQSLAEMKRNLGILSAEPECV